MSKSFDLKAIISLVDRISGPMKKINKSLRGPMNAMRGINRASNGLSQSIGNLLNPLTVLTGGAGLAGIGMAGAGIIHTNAQFEKFRTVLETIEGSSEKAKASMDWVTDFAAKTPYELAEVNDAFVRMRAMGLDPTNGSLRTLGDAAAGMNKPIMQAVEALVDAGMGDNGRLKELGINASKNGDMIAYRWSLNGKDMVSKTKATSEGIQKSLLGIWNMKFAGGMEKLSGTWDGMWSNMKDSFARFQLAIGDWGFFSVMKYQMSDLLQYMQSAAFDDLAFKISRALIEGVNGLRDAFDAIDWAATWNGIKEFASGVSRAIDFVGGFGNVLIGFAAIMAGPVILSVLSLAKALGTLVFFTGPVGFAIAAIAALAGVLYANWESISAWFLSMWETIANGVGEYIDSVVSLITDGFGQAFAGVKAIFTGFYGWFTGMWGGIINTIEYALKLASDFVPGFDFQGFGGDSSSNQGGGVRQNNPVLQAGAAANGRVGGSIDVKFSNAPAGTRVTTREDGAVSLNPNVGYDYGSILGVP